MNKAKSDRDYTPTVTLAYNMVNQKYGFTARITDIFDLLKIAFMIEDFEILDYKQMMNGPFQSYLMDKQKEWQEGKSIDFKEIYDAILKVGDFTGSEKRMFKDGGIEDRLWGIMLAVTSPGGLVE